jgi:hypothetical protein
VGTHLELQAGTNISATNVIINGTYSGSGTINGGPIPVEFSSFVASVNKKSVLLSWETATEANNKGFEIERGVVSNKSNNNKEGNSIGLNDWEVITFIEGHGTTNIKQSYVFSDNLTKAGKYNYRLKQIDFDGKYNYSEIVEVDIEIPNDFELSQNYPNPFNPTTKVNYQLPIASKVLLKVYDILGNEVRTLINNFQESGYYEVEFRAEELSSGIYIYILNAESIEGNSNYRQIKKMTLMK